MSYFMFGYFEVYIVIFPEYREPAKVYPVKMRNGVGRPHEIWKGSEQTFDMA